MTKVIGEIEPGLTWTLKDSQDPIESALNGLRSRLGELCTPEVEATFLSYNRAPDGLSTLERLLKELQTGLMRIEEGEKREDQAQKKREFMQAWVNNLNQ